MNRNIILIPLSLSDAVAFYSLYAPMEETDVAFTNRILSVCECIYTIRKIAEPDIVIGDCALHHWNKQDRSIEIGGLLLPEYWGHGIMAAAFEELVKLAINKYKVQKLVARTEASNKKAISFALKFGFAQVENQANNVVFVKDLKDTL